MPRRCQLLITSDVLARSDHEGIGHGMRRTHDEPLLHGSAPHLKALAVSFGDGHLDRNSPSPFTRQPQPHQA